MTVAVELAKSEDNEAALRTAVGRAYYAAFLTARDKAGISRTGPDVHNKVAAFYSRPQNKNVGNRLNVLRQDRNIADYNLEGRLSLQDAKRSVKAAAKVLAALA